MHDSIVHTEHLTKRYGQVVAVSDISLTITQGQIFGFLGLNGAGKTTTIRMLLGMIRPTSGVSYLFGQPVSAGNYSVWEKVGYLVETPYAYPELTVTENLTIIARLRGLRDKHVVERVMDKLHLQAYANRKAKHLSLGNTQRLGLAKALIHEPQLLILDEPTNGLDPAGIVEIRQLLQELVTNHDVTVFTSSHLLEEVAKLATSIGIIHQGRLLQELDVRELHALVHRQLRVTTHNNQAALALLTNHGYKVTARHDELSLTTPKAITHPDAIATLLVQAKLPPTLLTVESESLEAYFLRMIGEGSGNNTERTHS